MKNDLVLYTNKFRNLAFLKDLHLWKLMRERERKREREREKERERENLDYFYIFLIVSYFTIN